MKTPLLLVFPALALLCACSDKLSSAAHAGPARTRVDYKSALVALMANSYTGDCLRTQDGTPVAARIDVNAAGQVSSQGLQGNLMAPESAITATRSFGGAGPEMAISGGYSGSKWGMSLETNGDGGGVARISADGKGIRCKHAPQAAALKTKSLYQAIDGYVRPAVAGPLSCIKTDLAKGAAGAAEATLQFADGDAKFNNDVLSTRTGLQEEALTVLESGDLNYRLQTADGRTLAVGLDSAGTATLINVQLADGVTYACHKP